MCVSTFACLSNRAELEFYFPSPPLLHEHFGVGQKAALISGKVLALSLHGEGGEARRGEDLEGGGAPPPK